jgi:hypothetical protein
MGIPWMLNLGFGANRFVGQVSRSRYFNGFFTSLEMSPVKDLSLQAEYDGEDFNAGIKYSYRIWYQTCRSGHGRPGKGQWLRR